MCEQGHHVPVFQDKHGSSVHLRPLIPGTILEPAWTSWSLSSDVEEGQTISIIVLPVGPEPLVPLTRVGGIKMIKNLVMKLLGEGGVLGHLGFKPLSLFDRTSDSQG